MFTAKPTASPSQASTSRPTVAASDNLVAVLKGWQIGLIVGLVSLAIVVLLIVGAVGMGYLTIKNRNKPRAPEKMIETDLGPFPPKPRQMSMLEEIQLVGDAETDMVDCGGKETRVYYIPTYWIYALLTTFI